MLAYADDVDIISHTEEGTVEALDTFCRTATKYGLEMNTGKTKYLKIARAKGDPGTVTIGENTIERV
jgi:hypothetical protein